MLTQCRIKETRPCVCGIVVYSSQAPLPHPVLATSRRCPDAPAGFPGCEEPGRPALHESAQSRRHPYDPGRLSPVLTFANSCSHLDTRSWAKMIHRYGSYRQSSLCLLYSRRERWLSFKLVFPWAGDVRDVGSIPGSGRPPGGGNGNPLQYSCLENLS